MKECNVYVCVRVKEKCILTKSPCNFNHTCFLFISFAHSLTPHTLRHTYHTLVQRKMNTEFRRIVEIDIFVYILCTYVRRIRAYHQLSTLTQCCRIWHYHTFHIQPEGALLRKFHPSHNR